MVLNDIKMLCDSLFFRCYGFLFVAFVFFSPLIFTLLPLLSKLASVVALSRIVRLSLLRRYHSNSQLLYMHIGYMMYISQYTIAIAPITYAAPVIFTPTRTSS
jgi:hypothetical protein